MLLHTCAIVHDAEIALSEMLLKQVTHLQNAWFQFAHKLSFLITFAYIQIQYLTHRQLLFLDLW